MGIIEKSSFKITLLSYFGAGIGFLNKLLLFPIVLSTEEVGLSNLLANVGVLYGQLSALGITYVTIRFFPYFKGKDERHGGFLFWSSLIALGGFLLVTGLLFIFRIPIEEFYSQKSPLFLDYIYYLIPLGFSFLVYSIFDIYLVSLFKTVVPVLIYEVFLRVVVTAILGVYALDFLSFHQFVIIFVIANCLPALVILIYTIWLGQMKLQPPLLKINRLLKKAILHFGIFSFMNNISNAVMVTLDSILVAGMLGLEKTGIYTTIFFFASMLMIPYRAVSRAASPLVANHWRHKRMDEMQKLYKQVTDINIVMGCLIFSFVWVNLDLAFAYLPPAFSSGKWALLFLSIGKLFDMFSGINGMILITSKKYRWDVVFSLSLIVMLFALNVILIPLFDLAGAAMGTSIALILYNSARLIFVYANFGIHPIHFRSLFFIALSAGIILFFEFLPLDFGVIETALMRTLLLSGFFLGGLLILKPSDEVHRWILRLFGKRAS